MQNFGLIWRGLRVLLAVCSGIICVKCYGIPPSPTASAADKAARIVTEAGVDWHLALADARRWRDAAPKDADAESVCGVTEMRAGDISAARKCLLNAKKISKISLWENLLDGLLSTWDGHIAQALPQLESVVLKYPTCAFVWQAFYSAYVADANLMDAFQHSHAHSTVVASLVERYGAEIAYEAYALPRSNVPGHDFDTDIPITLDRDGRLWTTIEINGEPMKLIIDTGGGGLLLSKDAAARAKMCFVGKGAVAGATGVENITIMSAETAQIGSIKVADMLAKVFDRPTGQDLGDGVFGLPLLRNYDVVFDIHQMKLLIRRDSIVVPASSRYILPLHFQWGVPLLSCNINGKPRLATLDSGNSSITLSYGFAGNLSKGLAGSGVDTVVSTANSIGTTNPIIRRIGSTQPIALEMLTTNQTPYTLLISSLEGTSDLDATSNSIGKEIALSLGTPFLLMHQTIEIDYTQRRLVVTP